MVKLFLPDRTDPLPIIECLNDQKARNREQRNACHQNSVQKEPEVDLKEFSLREQELHVSFL